MGLRCSFIISGSEKRFVYFSEHCTTYTSNVTIGNNFYHLLITIYRFFNLVLLPRVRDDIAEYKRLNYHLYQVLLTVNIGRV